MELMQASDNWAQRPDDERFWSLEELHEVSMKHRSNACEAEVTLGELAVVPSENGGLALTGDHASADISHYAFNQVCQLAKAPASYLRTLPASMVSENLSYSLKKFGDRKSMNLLLDKKDDRFALRCATSDKYSRIWNADIVSKILPYIQDGGWRTMPARAFDESNPRNRFATKNDCSPASRVQEGELIGPAGIYASNKDMFLFFVDDKHPIQDSLFRGFFLENSEVGDRAFKLTCFLLNKVCGNHIVWGASDVQEIRIVHRGDAENISMYKTAIELKRYSESSVDGVVQKIEKAKSFILGQSKDEVIQMLLSKKIGNLNESILKDSLAMAENHPEDAGEKVSPFSAWGVAQGITRLSQDSKYTDERVQLDRVAGKILQVVF